MTELDSLLQFWKAKLDESGWLLSPSVQYFIKETIKHLEELNQLKGKQNG